MSFWAIWLVHAYYTMASYYTDLPFMTRSSCSYCMDLHFMVDSIDSSAVCGQLQFFRWLYQQWCCNDSWIPHMMDLLNVGLKRSHKQWPKQCWNFYYCLTWSSSFVYVFKLIDFRCISKTCISWRLLTNQVIQARQQRILFAWNSWALQFELRVIFWGLFLSDEYSASEEKQTEAIEYWSLYYTSTLQF